MMTIKIIHKENGIESTYLFEALNPYYEKFGLHTYKEWSEEYHKRTGEFNIPSTFIMDDLKNSEFTEDQEFTPVVITEIRFRDSFPDPKSQMIVFTRNSCVYIMQDGQTVDKFYC